MAICGPFGPVNSILFYRKMAIRVVGVAIRGAQELIALSQYRHIATSKSTAPNFKRAHHTTRTSDPGRQIYPNPSMMGMQAVQHTASARCRTSLRPPLLTSIKIHH